ncbi:hypothetical protein DOY81_001547 [Sarcophaga bullata]|nr:hypothetical protein DOY81_001547 [Sarcophaga bullata]
MTTENKMQCNTKHFAKILEDINASINNPTNPCRRSYLKSN